MGVNMPKMKFQWYFDLSTQANQMQIITVKCGGRDLVARLGAFFSAYKYYKLGKVSFKMIPASTLPVDPTGLSYEEGENTVDPRDQLTPGITRITNGEDFYDDISGMSVEDQHKVYNAMMLDPRWYKWSLQSGLRRSAVPLYWQVGQYHQDRYPGTHFNLPDVIVSGSGESATVTERVLSESMYNDLSADKTDGFGSNFKYDYKMPHSDPRALFQVGHRGRIGWLPTDGLQHVEFSTTKEGVVNEYDNPYMASPACVELFKIILPPAYKTKYYYRCYVTETCYFKTPVLNFMPGRDPSGLDRFIQTRGIGCVLPGTVGGASYVNGHSSNFNSGQGSAL